MNQSVDHTDVAAYAFDALDEQERRVFEAHLATCDTCQTEFAELGGMTAMFAALKRVSNLGVGPPVAAGPPRQLAAGGPDNVVELIRRRQRQARRYRQGTALLTAVAAVVVLAAGLAIGSSTGGHQPAAGPARTPHGPAPAPLGGGEQYSATNPRNGVAGTVALVKLGWGTQVGLRLGKVNGPLECELVAVAKDGTERVVTGWSVPPAGYGTPAHSEPLITRGGTSIPMSRLARFDVRVVGGGNLISIPI